MLKSRIDSYATSTAGALAAALARREIGAVELFEEAVRTIEERDGPINAVVVRDFDRARDAAKAADAALARGEKRPLLGVPMTVKEAHHVAGLPTTWGLPNYADWKPSWDATGVARLKAAGAVILGKTNVPPHLAEWQSDNPVYGRTNNPHDLTRTPGGSSGGSAAALAAGMVPLEFGSDIGGSIRVPAHFCGVYGHKPTWNLIPDTGHAPPGFDYPGPPTELGVIGPLARSAADLELALGVLAGPDGLNARAYSVKLPDPRGESLKGLRVLVMDEHPLCVTDTEVAAAVGRVADALEQGGAKLTRKSDALPDLAGQQGVYMQLLGAIMSRGDPSAKPIDAHAWMNAQSAQFGIQRRWAAVFEDIDVIIAPPYGTPAPKHFPLGGFAERKLTINGQETPYAAQLAWPGMVTLPGLPATCIPAGKTAAGLPVGVQVIGPYLEDLTTITVAKLLEGKV
ncbi:MAG: amidase family protein [Caulobacterales bacterium]